MKNLNFGDNKCKLTVLKIRDSKYNEEVASEKYYNVKSSHGATNITPEKLKRIKFEGSDANNQTNSLNDKQTPDEAKIIKEIKEKEEIKTKIGMKIG